MQFSNFSRIEDGLTITFKNDIPVEKVAVIKFFKDNTSGLFSKKEFRWSFNNAYWSSWETLTQSAFSSLNMHGNFYLFLQIRYTLTALGSGTVTSFSMTYTESDAISPTNPAHFHDDIEAGDASAVLIHDIIQHHTFKTIFDASMLNGYPGSYYLDRSHHTGSIAISQITNLQTILNSKSTYSYVDGSLLSRDASIINKVDILKTAGDIEGYVLNEGSYIDIGPVNISTFDYAGIHIEPSLLSLYVNEFGDSAQFSMSEEAISTKIPVIYDDSINDNTLSRQSLVTKKYDDARWTDINRYGFMNQTDTSIWFNPDTYVFTLSTSTGLGSWKYMRAGIEYTIDHDVSVQLFTSPDIVTRAYFIYIDSSDGTLRSTGTWTLNDTKVPVAIILYDASSNPTFLLEEERHTCLIDRREHLYNHSTQGTQYIRGGNLGGPTIGAAQDSSTTFSISSVTIADEDIIVNNTALSPRPDGSSGSYVVAYRKGIQNWGWKVQPVPFNYTDDSYIEWDNAGISVTGQPGKFYNYYLLFTTFDTSAKFILVPGRGEFNSYEEARQENPLTFIWTQIPISEAIIAYQFTWETSSGYNNKGKVSLVNTPRRIFSSVANPIPEATSIYHSLLGGLQGGNYDASEFYHLNASDYTDIVNDAFVRKTGDTMSGSLAINASLAVRDKITIGGVNHAGSALDVSGTISNFKGIFGTDIITNFYGPLNWTTNTFQSDTGTYYGMLYSAMGNSPYSIWQEYFKSRSIDGNTPAAVVLNDELGVFNFLGDNGDNNLWYNVNYAARFSISVDGTPATRHSPGYPYGYIPARFGFYTIDPCSGQFNSRMTIKHDGKVGIGTQNPSTYLDVSGNLHTTGSAKIDGSINVINSIYADGSAGYTGSVIAGQTMVFKNGILVQVI